MAKISSLPSQAIIDSLRGVLDFSVWCDLTIVRKWPRSPTGPRSPAVQRTSNQLSAFNAMIHFLDEETINAFRELGSGSSFTWKDMATRNYIDGTKDLYEYQE